MRKIPNFSKSLLDDDNTLTAELINAITSMIICSEKKEVTITTTKT